MLDRVVVRDQPNLRGRPNRARPMYEFVDRLPDGVTPAEARERVIAALGTLIAMGAAR